METLYYFFQCVEESNDLGQSDTQDTQQILRTLSQRLLDRRTRLRALESSLSSQIRNSERKSEILNAKWKAIGV